jgi:hypothetical protein
MDVLLSEFLLQLKSNILVVTLFLSLLYFLYNMINRKIEGTNRKIEGLGLTVHLIEKQLPDSIVHIVLTPSQASKTKDANLQSLLRVLDMNYPVLSVCEPKPSTKNFSKFKFSWTWGKQPESSVYSPFIDEVKETLLKLKLEIYDVSEGQHLWDQLFLYTTHLCTLRVLDESGKKTGPVYHKGRICGRTDLVVVDKGPRAYILTNNVRFVIEVKLRTS